MVDYNHYTYRITWPEKDQECVALCVEFPSLTFLGECQVAALNGITDLVCDVVQEMAREGETFPAPLSLHRDSGKFQARIPPAQHRELTMQAVEQGISLNRLVSMKLAQ